MIDAVAGITLEQIKEAASNATPGPWCLYGGSSLVVVTGEPRKEDIGAHSKNNNIFQTWQEANAAYIATASPDVVLSLVDRIEKLEKEADWLADVISRQCNSVFCDNDCPFDCPFGGVLAEQPCPEAADWRREARKVISGGES